MSSDRKSLSAGELVGRGSLFETLSDALIGVGDALVRSDKFFRPSMAWPIALVPIVFGTLLRVWIVRLQTPFLFKALVEASPPEMVGRLVERGPEVLNGSQWARDLGGAMGVFGLVVAVSFLLFLILAARGALVKFPAVFIPTAYASTVLTLRRAFAQILLQIQGEGSVRGPSDLEPSVGLGLFLREPTWLRILVDNVNVFDAAFIVVLGVGLMRCAEIGKRDAFVAAGFAWLTCVTVQGFFTIFVAFTM
jgi:hypothetical protein